MDDPNVIRYKYYIKLCDYIICSYTFYNYNINILKDFSDICPVSYYAELIEKTTQKKASPNRIDYEKIFITVLDEILEKAKPNREVLHDVCSRALAIYRVVEEPSDILFEKIEICLDNMNEKQTYWSSFDLFIKKYGEKYLSKMIKSINIFYNKVNYISLKETMQLINALVNIDNINMAIELCNMCMIKRFNMKEFSEKIKELMILK